MRTTVDLDDKLLHAAMEAARTKTKRETLEQGLRFILRYRHIERLRAKLGSGAVTWTLHDLKTWRRSERVARPR